MHVKNVVNKKRAQTKCAEWEGSRINKLASKVQLQGYTINQLCNLSIEKLQEFFHELKVNKSTQQIIKEPLKQCKMRLRFLIEVGLEYLTLDRLGNTLAGVEIQKVNLAQQLGSELTDTLYVLDAPSIGLHDKDIKTVYKTICELRHHYTQ